MVKGKYSTENMHAHHVVSRTFGSLLELQLSRSQYPVSNFFTTDRLRALEPAEALHHEVLY